MRSTAARSAAWLSKRNSPDMPHIFLTGSPLGKWVTYSFRVHDLPNRGPLQLEGVLYEFSGPIRTLNEEFIMVESNKTAADTYSLAIFRAIRRLQQAAEIHSKRLSRYGGLTPLQLLILHVLAVEGELTATQLAKLVSLSQASLSGVLDRLEGRGLLYRRRDEQDRRKSWLHLDPAGHEALAEAPPLLPEYVIERFAALPEWEAPRPAGRAAARGRPVRPAGRGRRRRVRAPGSLRKTVASAVFTWRTCRCLAGAGWWTSALRLSALHHGVTSA